MFELPRIFRSIFRVLRSSRTPLWRKGLLLALLLYLVSPFDLIPEAFNPLLGITDDFILLLLALRYFLNAEEVPGRDMEGAG